MTILIVEDDTAQAHYVEAMLTRMGVQCRVATTLQDAVVKLGSRQVSGVLCDLVLDTGSGLEVAKICNETRTPIVFVTATCDEHNVGKMYEYGFVIEKPVRIAALARAVEYFKYANKAIAFPPQADCETLRDYFEWHVQNGRGKYRCEMREHYLPLASGDTGVQNVASVTLSAASGAGTAALLLVRPLAQIPLSIASLMTEKEFWNQLPSAPQIRDGACLGFILGTGAAVAAATTFAGANEVVWG